MLFTYYVFSNKSDCCGILDNCMMSDLISKTTSSCNNDNDPSNRRICPLSRFDCRDREVILKYTSITFHFLNLFLVRRTFIARTLQFGKTPKISGQMRSTDNTTQE